MTLKETTYIPMLRDLPADLRPRERIMTVGPAGISNSELLAIILGSGTVGQSAIHLAESLLARFGGLPGIAQANFEELCSIPGIGPAKATQIKSALEVGRRLLLSLPTDRLQIRSPADVADLLMLELGLYEEEHMRVVILDTKNNVIAVDEVYKGSLNTAVVRIGEVFRSAIRKNAASIIVVHNHPSGDPTPSPEDVRVTEMLVDAGKLLDIAVLDHVIIGRNRFVSLKDRGLGFR